MRGSSRVICSARAGREAALVGSGLPINARVLDASPSLRAADFIDGDALAATLAAFGAPLVRGGQHAHAASPHHLGSSSLCDDVDAGRASRFVVRVG